MQSELREFTYLVFDRNEFYLGEFTMQHRSFDDLLNFHISMTSTFQILSEVFSNPYRIYITVY